MSSQISSSSTVGCLLNTIKAVFGGSQGYTGTAPQYVYTNKFNLSHKQSARLPYVQRIDLHL
jgi:hypothetical protein